MMNFKKYLFLATIILLFSTVVVAQSTENQIQAFKVLEKKCNTCHQTDKPKQVYTLDNMNSLAKKINKQVFIKKRMPKGDDIKLTEEEYEQLKSWLLSLSIK